VKAPTLVCDDNEILMDSGLILDYMTEMAGPGKSLMPPAGLARRSALQLVGLGLMACEKTVQLHYETNLRPPEKQHQPWVERITGQLQRAYDMLEPMAVKANAWLIGDTMTQADITVAVAWRFTRHIAPHVLEDGRHPGLAAHSKRAEALPEFSSTPLE
jgi:glutathione S-transferase